MALRARRSTRTHRPSMRKALRASALPMDWIERIGRRVALADRRELLQRIYDNTPVLFVMWEPRLRRFTLNRHAESVLGWSTEEANRSDFMSLVYPDPEYRKKVSNYMHSLNDGFREWSCYTKGGEEIAVEWANIQLTDDAMIGIGVDLRARKRIEDQLREANLKLKEADRRKDEFLAALSHELRNPLAPIRCSLSLIQSAPADSSQMRRSLEVIDRQVNLLSGLVNDLLDITRISRGKVQLRKRRIDLVEAVRHSVEDHRPLFAETGIRLELDCPPGRILIEADANRMGQIIGNLLQNAAKFSKQGGRSRVTVGVEGAGAVVRVADNGIGMAPETLEFAFEAFTQEDRELDRSKGGLGLGLTLCKRLVALHGGTISAHSEGPGKGAEICICLPLCPDQDPDAAAVSDTPSAPKSAEPLRVLIIEDQLDAADSLCAALQYRGHEVTVANNGGSGLESARKRKPEVVLCDIGLPGMDGYEVARRFREDTELKDVRLVALSGYALPDDVSRALAAGFDQHLAKPPSLDQLTEALKG